ncbi:FecR family protein [Seonamhaeicola sp. NFXS20]|uniref:FecR family protein n=1 Tax=Seonamhaeicola sp. NFXS20 TaxID=2816959 RepID=UPI003B8AB1F6
MEFKLILKKLNNRLTEEEAAVFNEWYNESDLHREYFDKVKDNIENDELLVDVKKGWESINKQISPTSKKINYWKYAIAASIVLLVSITFLLKQNSVNDVKNNSIIVTNNIKAGTDKAKLTLEDGSEINLEKGTQYISNNLKSNGEELIYKSLKEPKSVEIAYNYLTVPRGGQFTVVLSDGTKVWLNSETQLKYPVKFIQGKEREVELVYGEAFFDVTPSSQHKGAKFKVHHKEQDIEVLGTEFNIKAYKNESNIYTTLVEGRVSVSVGSKVRYLKPKQKSNLSLTENTLTVANTDTHKEIAWREGVFNFDSVEMKEIMKVLSRWYDIDVSFERKELENKKFTGLLNKHYSIVEILTTMKNVNAIQSFEINNKHVSLK